MRSVLQAGVCRDYCQPYYGPVRRQGTFYIGIASWDPTKSYIIGRSLRTSRMKTYWILIWSAKRTMRPSTSIHRIRVFPRSMDRIKRAVSTKNTSMFPTRSVLIASKPTAPKVPFRPKIRLSCAVTSLPSATLSNLILRLKYCFLPISCLYLIHHLNRRNPTFVSFRTRLF